LISGYVIFLFIKFAKLTGLAVKPFQPLKLDYHDAMIMAVENQWMSARLIPNRRGCG